MSILGGILSGLASSFLGNVVSNGFSVSNYDGTNKKTIKGNPVLGSTVSKLGSTISSSAIESANRRQEEQFKYDLAVKKWQMENEYNHPKKQVQRLVEAGLNPALAYGGANAGNAGSVASTSALPYSGDQMDLVGTALQVKEANSRIANQDMMTKLGAEDVELRKREQLTEELKQDNLQLDKIIKDMEGKKGTKEYEILQKTADDLVKAIKLKNDALSAGIQNTNSSTFKNFMDAFHAYQQGLTSQKSRKVMDHTIQEIGSRIKLNDAEAKHFIQLATNEKYDELKEKYNAQLRMLGIDPENHSWTGQLGRMLTHTFSYVANEMFPNDYPIPIDPEDSVYYSAGGESSAIDSVDTGTGNWTPPRPRYTTPPYRAVWK